MKNTRSLQDLSRRGFLAGTGATALTLALAACGANERSSSGASSATPTKGGTLTILQSSPDINWDPAKSQGMAVTSLALVHRRLTTWRIVNGQEATVIPDLATDIGKVSADGLTWTYTLKDGLFLENGSAITSSQIKYGLERTFADALSGGLGYHKALLADTKGYTGPYQGKQLASVETPDEKTIVFHLAKPYGDWPWIASTPGFAPVPPHDNPATYARKPVASGPYRVADYKQGVSSTLERNPKWSAVTDKVRTALPNSIVFSLGQDQSVSSQRLIADSGADKNAFGADLVAAAQLAQVAGNPSAKSRLATASAGPLQYLAINVDRVTDLDVRRAIAYATDKKAVVAAFGGDLGAVVATTYITPGIPGREVYDLYPTSADKAKDLLKGKKVGKLVLLTPNDDTSVAVSQAIQQSLQKVGLSVTIDPVQDETWTERATQGNGSSYDLTIGSWNPDYPSANANLQPLFASSAIGDGGYNVSRYKNAEVDKLLIDTAALPIDKARPKWAAIDKRIAEDSPVVPLVYRRNSFLHGSGVTNFFVNPFPSYPNYLVVGVTD